MMARDRRRFRRLLCFRAVVSFCAAVSSHQEHVRASHPAGRVSGAQAKPMTAAPAATKGADLDRRMYALGPTALADEAASLLWDDGRWSLYAGVDAAAAPGLSALQREVLGAAALLWRLCDEGPEWRVAVCEALAAAPAAVDTALALLARRPRVEAGARPAGACAARHVRPGDVEEDEADEPGPMSPAAAAALRSGPAGLIHKVAAATHPVLETIAGSRWWPRAAATLARLARGEGHGDDGLKTICAETLQLVLSVGPVRAAAEMNEADRAQVCGAGADLACARDRRCLACCRPATLACACRRVVFCRRGRGDCQRRVWRQHRAGCRAAAPAQPSALQRAYDEATARLARRRVAKATDASPLDYSRFDKIDVSDDDDDPPRVEQPYAARSIEFCHPSTWKPPRAPVARASEVSHPSSWSVQDAPRYLGETPVQSG